MELSGKIPNFELNIRETEGIFEAESLAFPGLIGLGATKDEAINNLADNIGNHLGNALRESFAGMVKELPKLMDELKNKDKVQIFNQNKSDVIIEKVFEVPEMSIPQMKPGKGGLMVLGFNKNLKAGSSSYLKEIMEVFIDNGDFPMHETSGIRLPEGVLIGIPLSFN